MVKPKQDDRCKACLQAELDIENLQQQLQALRDGVNRRCGEDNNQLPLVSVDKIVEDNTTLRGLLREACEYEVWISHGEREYALSADFRQRAQAALEQPRHRERQHVGLRLSR